MKARFVCKCRDNGNAYITHLFYEYRGREYMVTLYANGCCAESLREQHRREQERIDGILDTPEKIEPPAGDVEKAMADFWAYCEGEN
ncbi:MAG: hypothetical protein J6U20_03860 [Fibrobacter sp.]|nr:hypothetical protein [Fibrobacter sp.]